jgi:hypothetical protein
MTLKSRVPVRRIFLSQTPPVRFDEADDVCLRYQITVVILGMTFILCSFVELLDILEELLPKGQDDWEALTARFNRLETGRPHQALRSDESLKKKFKPMYTDREPTGTTGLLHRGIVDVHASCVGVLTHSSRMAFFLSHIENLSSIASLSFRRSAFTVLPGVSNVKTL